MAKTTLAYEAGKNKIRKSAIYNSTTYNLQQNTYLFRS
jgi:hypothetical protein